MKVDFTKTFVNLDGEEIIQDSKPITLGSVTANILLSEPDDKLTGEQKVTRYNLALAAHAAKEPIEMRVEDVALIKEVIGRLGTPLIVGQAWKMLEE